MLRTTIRLAAALTASLCAPHAAFAAEDYAGEYELVERTQREVPNFQAAGRHYEIAYVQVHDGHRFYATCDATTVNTLDSTSSCALAVLRKYPCRLGKDGDKAMSDLVCKDQYGGNV